MRRSPGPSLVLAAVALVLGATACTGGGPRLAGPPVDKPGPRIIYVAIGASESVGFGTGEPLRQAWTQVLYRTALPRSATFINLGIPGATVARAIQDEAPQEVALRPDLVTVWLNVNDLIAEVPPATYQRELDELVTMLGGDGTTTVLMANTPPLDHLPAYLACKPFFPTEEGCDGTRRLPASLLNEAVARYNDAIAQVAAAHGAVLVDLHAAALAAREIGTEASLVSSDGFHPSPAGHLLVAETFAAALRQSSPQLMAPPNR